MSRLGQFVNFIKFVWNHADQLVALFEVLPAGLRAAGVGIESAGDGAVLAGRTLGGNTALPINAADVLSQAANAVDQCHFQVKAAAQEIRDVATALDQVKVPTVSPQTHHFDFHVIGLGEWDLVTGLSFGQAGLFGAVTSNMRAQAGVMDTQVGGQLQTASQRLDSMSQTLDNAGNNLKTLGDALKQGGNSLQQLGQP